MRARLLGPGEYVVLANRAHPARLWRPAAAVLVAVFLASALQVLAQEGAGYSAAAVLVLVLGLGLAGRWTLRWWTTGYVLTSRRLLVTGGLRPRIRAGAELERIGAMRVLHPGLARMRGQGAVLVEVQGRAWVLTGQRRPERFLQICEEYRRRRHASQPWRWAPV